MPLYGLQKQFHKNISFKPHKIISRLHKKINLSAGKCLPLGARLLSQSVCHYSAWPSEADLPSDTASTQVLTPPVSTFALSYRDQADLFRCVVIDPVFTWSYLVLGFVLSAGDTGRTKKVFTN